MGTQVNAQIGGEKEYVKATLKMSQLAQIRQLTPYFHYEWLFKLFPAGKEHGKVLKILHGFSNKVGLTKINQCQCRKESMQDLFLYASHALGSGFLVTMGKTSLNYKITFRRASGLPGFVNLNVN